MSAEESYPHELKEEVKKKHNILSPIRWFEKHRITKNDLPRAFAYFKGLTYVSWLGLWGLCYRFRPFKTLQANPFFANIFDKLKIKFTNAHNKYTTFYNTKIEQLSKNKYFKAIPSTLGLHSKRFAISFVESLISYKLTLPITLPTNIYLSAKLIEGRNNKKQNN